MSVLKYDRTIGIVAMEGRGFSNPVDLAISPDDRMYVLSRTNPLQPYGIRVGICDLESNYFGNFGSYGSDPGQFIWPTALAFDRRGRLLLADEYNHRVTIYQPDGTYVDHWGTRGSGRGEFDGPAGLALNADGNVLVSDSFNGRIQTYTPDGSFISSFGSPGDAAGQFNMPWGIAVDNMGFVYVADWRNDRIQKWTPDGEFVTAFGGSGTEPGHLNRPSSVAVDLEGLIYVADWGNERVQVLDPAGQFLQELRGEATLSPWAQEFFAANPEEWREREASNITPELSTRVKTAYQVSATIEPFFWAPVCVRIDKAGRLYVVESNRHRIQVYAKQTT